MEFLVFLVVAAVCIASAVMLVTQRNAMYSALFLVMCFFCFAVFFVLLGAYFLAVVQVAVYAGAIMVLMLIGHTQQLASVLFTKFLVPFEVTSILLLGAILGASVLTRKRPELT
jgi:NADH:ubiquinone oxidoreductase subunit 6 (subunit J)